MEVISLSSYHSSFTYLNKNSLDQGFKIASFDHDNGAFDTFLNMEQVFTSSYDGTKKHLYGLKYNSSASISITLIKCDGTDFSIDDNRKILKWLTGCRQASWLDFYVSEQLLYSFFGAVTNCQQQKLDARVIGMIITFESVHPWAYSAPQSFNCHIGASMLELNSNGVITTEYSDFASIKMTKNGVLYNDKDGVNVPFQISEKGVVYNNSHIVRDIDNQTDELYSYITLDVTYKNKTGNSLTIYNETLDEKTEVSGLVVNEVINLSAGQFIISNISNKIFGDDFNFIWPRLGPGINRIILDADGEGLAQFTYRYPIKIGDCAIDIGNLIGNSGCCGSGTEDSGGNSTFCTVDEVKLNEMLNDILWS